MVNPDATPQSQTPLKRQVVGFVRQRFGVTERRACRQLGFWRSTQRHKSPGEGKDEALKTRLRVLALERPRFGYRRLHVLLKREGQMVNHKPGVADLSGRGAGGAAQGSQKAGRWRTDAETSGFCRQSALEHGFHV